MESLRFRRAMYRLMLYSKLFPVEAMEEYEAEQLDPDDIYQARRQRKEFLAEFSSLDLRCMHSVALFLIEVSKWVIIADGDCLNSLWILGTSSRG